MTRVVTNADVKKYRPMVEKFLRDSVVKNWNEGQLHSSSQDITLGNTGMSLADFRQYLMMELVVALQKYNPDYRTPDDKSVKESTFVFCHLNNRIGQCMKRLTKRRFGYGFWMSNLEEILDGTASEE